MKLNDGIELDPDAELIITDSVNAQRAASALGLANELAHISTFSDSGFCLSENHATHWIVLGHIRGHANSADNGPLVMCYPKKHFTFAEVHKRIESYLHIDDSYFEIGRDAKKE